MGSESDQLGIQNGCQIHQMPQLTLSRKRLCLRFLLKALHLGAYPTLPRTTSELAADTFPIPSFPGDNTAFALVFKAHNVDTCKFYVKILLV